jgi:hypothetical protein
MADPAREFADDLRSLLGGGGFEGGTIAVYPADLETLVDYGLLRMNVGSRGTERFDLTPDGKLTTRG